MLFNKKNFTFLLIFLLLNACVSTQKKDSPTSFTSFNGDDFRWKDLTGKAIFVTSRSNISPKVQEEVYAIPAIQQLMEAKEHMPESLNELTQNFINKLLEQYPELTNHQKEMFGEYAKCNLRVLSKNNNPKRFSFIHNKLQKAFLYLRNNEEIKSGYAFVGNIAKKEVGGQKGYIINMATGELVEFDLSSAWKGVGFENDSNQTPLGYFLVYKDYHQKGWQSKTKTTDPKHIFYKLQGQTYEGEAMYIYRKNTKIERAYICSNQFGLIGQNSGSEYVDLAAPKYLKKSPDEVCYIDNSNSGNRQLYIHGTNRVDQLGFALSGGCVRVSNVNSFIIKEIVMKQGTMPVFIDAVAYHAPKPVKVPGFDDTDLESIYNSQSIVIRKQNLLDSISLGKRLYSKVLPSLANSIAYRMSKVDNQTANVDIYVTVPFPESAMKYWLALKNMDDYSDIPLQQRFGFKGEYFENVNRIAPNPFFKAYHTKEINSYFSKRIIEATEALHSDLSIALEKYKLNPDTLLSSVQINGQTLTDDYFNIALDSIEPLEYFSISDERNRVLHYMDMIDSMTQVNPEAFENWEHLKWIDKFLYFRDNLPLKEHRDLDYHDVVLMQAYIYALGEEELYKRDVRAGELVSVKGQPFQEKLIDKFGLEGSLALLDEAGLWKLFQYSHSSDNKTLMKMVSVAYPKEDMLNGMRMLAEAYYSKYKWVANRYVIISEVNGEAIFMAD